MIDDINEVNEVNAIIAYEQGELDELDTIYLFQHLINTGRVWDLQGSYGRTAKALIEGGFCKLPMGMRTK